MRTLNLVLFLKNVFLKIQNCIKQYFRNLKTQMYIQFKKKSKHFKYLDILYPSRLVFAR